MSRVTPLGHVTDLRVFDSRSTDDASWHLIGSTDTAHIFYQKGEGSAITGLVITEGSTSPGEGWEQVDHRSLEGSSGDGVFLWATRDKGKSAIVSVKMVTSGQKVYEGFTRMNVPLNPSAGSRDQVFLCFQRRSKSGESQNEGGGEAKQPDQLEKGDLCDVRDTNVWRVATVIAKKKNGAIHIHYEGWESRWDEWVDPSRFKVKVAPWKSMTKGRYTGPGGGSRFSTAFDVTDHMDKFADIARELDACVQKAQSGAQLNKDEERFVVTGENSDFLSKVLCCEKLEKDVLGKVQDYLQSNLRFMALRFADVDRTVPQQLANMLERIFNGNAYFRRYYDNNGRDDDKTVSGKFAVRRKPKAEKNAREKPRAPSKMLVANIEFFGEIGGFDALRTRLLSISKLEQKQSGESKSSSEKSGEDIGADDVGSILTVLHMLNTVRFLLQPKFLSSYLGTLQLNKVVCNVIAQITDREMRSLEKDAWTRLTKDVESLMRTSDSVSTKEVAEFIETVQLQIALRLIKSKVLGSQLGGLVQLERCIHGVNLSVNEKYEAHKPRQAAGGGGGMWGFRRNQPREEAEIKKAQFITPKKLVAWLQDNKIVDIVLSPTAHEQVIKKSPLILKFLAQNKALSVQDTDKLWAAAEDQHEQLVRIVHDTLGELAEVLSEKQLKSLYQRIDKMPLHRYQDFDMNFLKLFTANAVKATRGKEGWFGLHKFWDFLQYENSAGYEGKDGAQQRVLREISDIAFSELKELLAKPAFVDQRKVFLQKCMDALKSGKSPVTAYRVAAMVCELFGDDRNKTIDQLGKKQKLLELVLAEIKTYHDAAIKGVEGKYEHQVIGADGKSEGPDYVGSPYQHTENISQRLNVLAFFLRNSKLELSDSNIGALWELFVDKPVQKADTDTFMNWLQQGLRAQLPWIAHDSAESIFKLLIHPKHTKISVKWYDTLEKFFIQFNYQKKALYNTSRQWLVVTNHDGLQGLDELWELLHTQENESVIAMLRAFLTTLYIRLELSLPSQGKKVILGKFVTLCMKGLTEDFEAYKKALPSGEQKEKDSQNSDSAALYQKIRVMVTQLANFIRRLDSGEMMRRPLFEINDRVMAFWRGRRTKKYPGVIREVNPDGTYFVLYNDGDNDRACPEDNIFHMRDRKTAPPPADDSVQKYPRELLSASGNTDKYYALFFDLLGLGGDVGRQMWPLLETLPTDRTLAKAINTLPSRVSKDINWAETLYSGSLMKLQYVLQVVEKNLAWLDPPKLAEGQETPQELPLSAQSWAQAFAHNGGVAHLAQVLLDNSVSVLLEHALTQECAITIASIIHSFLGGAHRENGGESPVGGAEEELADKLMQVLNAAVKLNSKRKAAVRNVAGKRCARLVGAVLSLLVSLSNSESVLKKVLAFGEWNDILDSGLLKNPNKALRVELASHLADFTATQPAAAAHFAPILLGELQQLDGGQSSTQVAATEYFGLLQNMMSQSSGGSSTLTKDAGKLARQLSSLLRQQPLVEKTEKVKDQMLVDLLSLSTQLVRRDKQFQQLFGAEGEEAKGNERHGTGILTLVFDYLFELPAFNFRRAPNAVLPPKCKHTESRQAAFALLLELVKGHQVNTAVLCQLLSKNHATDDGIKSASANQWEFRVTSTQGHQMDERRSYVGLKNLGCICYMNASVQQLFMIPALRRNLLAIDSYGKFEKVEDSFIYQFQCLMARLQESQSAYTNPKHYTDVWMDETNKKPIQTGKQEDSADYLLRLIDRVQTGLAKTQHKDCFKSVIGGVISNELIGRGECPHFKSREQDMYMLNVEVKDKKTLVEGLDAFVRGETMSGSNQYRCSRCKKKVDIMKRQVIKKLPPTLFVVMKRFYLDYTTFTSKKLNHRVEFPRELDLKPYTAEYLQKTRWPGGKRPTPPPPEDKPEGEQEGKGKQEGKGGSKGGDESEEEKEEDLEMKPDHYYQYRLKGVVVHTGTANSGHYYSFIEERVPEIPGQPLRWFQFNDRSVTPFDPKDLEDECYGGEKANVRSSFGGKPNGYVLIYDRVPAPPVDDGAKTEGGGEPKEKLSFANAALALKAAGKIKAKADDNARQFMPPPIFNEIWEANMTRWKDKLNFDPVYQDYLWRIVDAAGKLPEIKDKGSNQLPSRSQLAKPVNQADAVTRLACSFFFNTLCRSANKDSLLNWCGMLKKLLCKNVASSAWFLDWFASRKQAILYDVLFDTPPPLSNVRRVAGDLLSVALANVVPLEAKAFAKPPLKRLPSDNTLSAPSVESNVEGKEGEESGGGSQSASEWKDPRGYSTGLIDQLVYLIKYVPGRGDKRVDVYLRILWNFANLGDVATRYLLKHHNIIARMLDIYLGDQSPYPDISNVPTDKHGSKPYLGDFPDLTHFYKLLRRFVDFSAADDENNDQDNIPLSKEALEMLVCPAFLDCLVVDATTYARGQDVLAIVRSLIKLAPKDAPKALMAALLTALDKSHYSQTRPLFRVLPAVLDTASDEDVASALENLCKMLFKNQRYWKVFDMTCDHLIRLSITNDRVRGWLAECKVVPDIVAWYEKNPSPPHVVDKNKRKAMYADPACVVTHKDIAKPDRRHFRYHQPRHGYSAQSLTAASGLSVQEKVAFFQAIAKGEKPDLKEIDDSDMGLGDREWKKGQLLDACDNYHKWYEAQIVVVDNNAQQVKVHFVAFDSKWDEWIPMTSPRLAPHLKYSKVQKQVEDLQKKKNRK